MPLPLPPLAAIRAFEAAARHASFTKAAEELGMTQAAVSYQIKVLEERVGVPLFLRRPRQVVLTEAGQRLAPAVSEAFALLSEAYAAVRTGAQGTLVISTIQTFGSNWLARHLGSFQIAHPSIAVRLDTSSHMVDFAREEIDVGIRSGGGKWPGLAAHMLFPRRLHADAQSAACRQHRRREGARRPACACPSSTPATAGGCSGLPPPGVPGRRTGQSAPAAAWARRPPKPAPRWPGRAWRS